MADVPASVLYGRITGRFVSFLADTSDAGDTPDEVALTGTVTLTPSVGLMRFPNTTPPRLAVLKSISCTVDSAGNLKGPDGVTEVWVIASSQPDGTPDTVQWTATFSFNGVSSAEQPNPITFEVPAGGVIDLVTVVSVNPDTGTVNVLANASSYALANHTHGVDDLTATGTKDNTTFLRGDNVWAVPAGGGGGGVTDHGALTGLSDDDHPQYHNNARGDARYYTQAQVDSAISDAIATLLGGAPPEALDTLNELAAAINDDESFAATVTTALAGKAALVHTHVIDDVTGLQAALDGKATSAQGAKADTAVQPAAIDDMVVSTTISNIVSITRTAYDALGTPDSATLYLIDESA